MAFPKTHAITSSPLLFTALLQTGDERFFLFLSITFWGIMIDIDHADPKRLTQIIKKEKGWKTPRGNWTNLFHTQEGAQLAFFYSLWINNPLPFIAYAIHMLIDTFNRDVKNSQLCEIMGIYIPDGLKYSMSFNTPKP